MGKKHKKNLKKKLIFNEIQKIDSQKDGAQTTMISQQSVLPSINNIQISEDQAKELDKNYVVTIPDLKKFLVISLGLIAILVVVTVAQSKTSFLTNLGDSIFSKLNIFQL
jgi:hypothetical protein